MFLIMMPVDLVIIAGDDAVAPVLGYTSTGAFDANNLPEGLKDLLKELSSSRLLHWVKTIRQMLLRQEPNLLGEKLLNTAKWNQGAPFNKYTPE